MNALTERSVCRLIFHQSYLTIHVEKRTVIDRKTSSCSIVCNFVFCTREFIPNYKAVDCKKKKLRRQSLYMISILKTTVI